MSWTPTDAHSKLGVVKFSFNGNSVKYGLTLRIGELVHILEETEGWFRGFSFSNKGIKGIFPRSFIVLKECKVDNPGAYETLVPLTEPVVQEVTSVLREWGIIWKKLYLDQNEQMFIALKSIMIELMDYRQHIISKNITEEQQAELKNRIVQKIDWGNSKLGLDLVPRIDGEIVNVDHLSVFELYKVHLQGQENTSAASGTGTLRRTSPASKATSHHLFFGLRSFMCNVGDECGISFALYDSKTSEYISEKYIARYSKYGMPKDPEKLDQMFAIFSNLSSSDLRKDVYLVCQIIREGRLLVDSKKNPSSAVRRPFGCGVTFVGDVLRGKAGIDEEELELNIAIHCPSNEDDFYGLQDSIIKKQTAKYNASGSNPSAVCICVRMFHGELEKVIKENPLVFATDVAETKKIGFPDVIMPGDFRNDFYLTIKKAELERGSKTSQRNVELVMNVISSDGKIIPNSIALGTGEEPISEYHSFVIYHNNCPIWNEDLKLQIPLELIHNCHLRFTFSHSSRHEGKTKGDKMFGFSFLKLLNDDGTVTVDGSHNLFIYKIDSTVDFSDTNSYLSLPMSASELEKQRASGVVYAGPSRNSKESFTIVTKLCSTKFSQNHELVSLLKWRLKPDGVKDVLRGILGIKAEEIVKFLQDVFDALFNILSGKGELLAMDVFTVLVYILSLVEDEKFVKFKSTVTTYIDEHFSGALAFKSLVSSLKELLKTPSLGVNSVTLLNALKSLPFLYKFVIKSKELHSRSKGNHDEVELKGLLEDLFSAICEVLSSKSASLMNVKEAALEKIPLIIDESLSVFSYDEFSVVLCNIINCVPKKASHLQTVKLGCIRKVVAGKLFQNEDARTILFPLVVEHLVFHLERRQEHSICLEILGDIISSMKAGGKDAKAESEVEQLANSLLTILLNVFLTIDRRGPLTGATVACMVGILKLMNENHFDQFLERFSERADLKDFLTKILVAFKELMSQDFFPKDWYVLRILCNNLVLTAVQHLSRAFTDHFLRGDDFDQQLWNNFFQLAIMFITQPSLQLESFIASKRETILDRYGDMRQIMGFEIVSMWENLDEKKAHFIPHLIGPFLEVTLIPETELRKATIPIFYDMMKVEFSRKGNFNVVERELIDKLDILVSQDKGDEDYEKLFKELMSEQVGACFDPALRETGMVCVDAVCQLLRRLLDYRNVMASYDCGMDQMMMCTVRLLKFYKRISREDMYLRYVYKLCDLHLRRSNFTEAGCTLLLHADLLEWNDDIMPKSMKFPAQTERERKEQLYTEITDYFDKGKTWENGIRLCKELSQQYETAMFDYNKLSKMLRVQAQFYDNIMTELRPEPEYFRIAFYGKGFPYYLKNQEYIYRGLEYEKLANFTQRLRLEFPNAKVMSKNSPPDDTIVNSPGQYIQVCNVQPIATGLTMFEKKPINEKVKGYYKVNDVYTFTYSRPFRRGSKEESEFSTLWLEKTTCQTREQFPGIVRWSKIESVEKVELNPLQNAIESIAAKNRELAEMIYKFEDRPEGNLNPLSMILNGVIDANVNGGIANYQKAFLVEEYGFLHPEEGDNITLLKELLKEQVYVLASGLQLHERLATASIRGLHDKMVVMFDSLRQSVETGRPIEEFMSSLPQLNTIMDGASTLPLQGSPKSRRVGITTNETPKSHMSMPQLPRGFSFATISRRVNSAISSSSPTLNRNSSPSVNELPGQRPSSSATSSPVSQKKPIEPVVTVGETSEAPPLPPRQSFSGANPNPKRRATQSLTTHTNIEPAEVSLSGSMPSLFNISEDSEDLPPALPVKKGMDKRRSTSTLGLEEFRSSSDGIIDRVNQQSLKVSSQAQDRRKSADSIIESSAQRLPPALPSRKSDSNLSTSAKGEITPKWQRSLLPDRPDPSRPTTFDFSIDGDFSSRVSIEGIESSSPRKVPQQSTSPLGEIDDVPPRRVVPAQSTTPLGSLSPRSGSSSQSSPLSISPSGSTPVDFSTVLTKNDKQAFSGSYSDPELSAKFERSRTPSPSRVIEGTEHSSPVAERRRMFENKASPSKSGQPSYGNPKANRSDRDDANSKKMRPFSLPIDSDNTTSILSNPPCAPSKSDQDVRAKKAPKPRPRTMVIKSDTGRSSSGEECNSDTSANRNFPRGKPPPVPPKKPNRVPHNSTE